MSEITMFQVTELDDPKLRKIATRIAREAELAIEKVAANRKRPTKYPLTTDPSSIERILADRFAAFRTEQQEVAALTALQHLSAPTSVRTARFGDLMNIDLCQPTPVDVQAKALPFPASLRFPLSHLQMLASLQGNGAESPGLVPHQTTHTLELRIHKVTCIDETAGFPFGDAGDGEIDLGATTVDESGETRRAEPFRVGTSFDDGESKTYSPPRRFTTFDLGRGTAYPKSYFVTFMLAEADSGGLPEFVAKLLTAVRARVITVLTTAIGGGMGASGGGPMGAMVGTVVGYCVGEIFELFRRIWEDDVFKPRTVGVTIPSLAHRWPGGQTGSPQDTVEFRGRDGKYRLVYDWRLQA